MTIILKQKCNIYIFNTRRDNKKRILICRIAYICKGRCHHLSSKESLQGRCLWAEGRGVGTASRKGNAPNGSRGLLGHVVFHRENMAVGSEQVCLVTFSDLDSFICAWGCWHLTRKPALDGYKPFHKGPTLAWHIIATQLTNNDYLFFIIIVIIPLTQAAQKILTEAQKYYTRT